MSAPSMTRKAAAWSRALAAALLLAVSGCGDPDSLGGGTDTGEPVGTASGFTVGQVPDGYEPVTAGVGNATPDWGADSFGTHEPFTVLAPPGSSDPAERVVVSITGFEGYQGKLDQTLYMHGHQIAEPITVDGRDARHIPAGGESPAVLVAVRGDDLAVRVVAPVATLEELTEILAAVEVPSDRTRALEVPSPPGGLEVVGSVDVDAVLAMWFGVEANTGRMSALDSTHVAGWMNGRPSTDEGDPPPGDLAVLTLPGRAADRASLSALELWEPNQAWTWEQVDVAGDPALTVEMEPDADAGGWAKRAVWRWTDRGDIVVVTASTYGGELPPMDTLVELSAGVVPADADSWEQFVIEMTGGPGLNPDDGRAELARGTQDGLGWLLQNGPYDSAEMPGAPVNDTVDRCLKLSDRRRACVATSGTMYDWVGTAGQGQDRTVFDDLVIVSTTLAAHSLRITTRAGEAEVPLTQLPDSPARAAVAFVEQPGQAACTNDFPIEPPEGMTFMRIDALDPAGAAVGCIGMGGHPNLGG